jgi:hypothetical protein
MMRLADLLRNGPAVINIGARDFAENLKSQEVSVVEIDWRPPFTPDAEMAALLEKLL